MGLRSWLTPIKNTGKDWKKFQDLLAKNEASYGIHYVIDITSEIPFLDKGLWVAWSGDGGYSLEEMGKFIHETVFLDNLLERFPDFRDPTPFGKLLTSETIIGYKSS